jgi:hypothetical protein
MDSKRNRASPVPVGERATFVKAGTICIRLIDGWRHTNAFVDLTELDL